MKKFNKSIRHIHQYLQVGVETEVYLDLRGHPNMVALEISAMESLTSKTWIVWKFLKFMRQNHQYLFNRKLNWIFEVTQMSWLSRKVSNRSLELEKYEFFQNRFDSFRVSKDNVAIWQKYRFSHPIGQMDLSCSQTIQNEICQNCWETIPLVQVCFRFELPSTVLKLLSKIWVNPWNFDQIFAVFGVFLGEMASEEF